MRWIKWFEKGQEELLLFSVSMEKPQNHNEPAIESTDKGLEAELRLAKTRIATLETIIDIAEEEFKIEIRKKSVTKPSIE